MMDPKGKKNKPERRIEMVCLVRTGDWNFRLDDEGRLLWDSNICIKFLKKVRMGIIIWKKSNQDRENRNSKALRQEHSMWRQRGGHKCGWVRRVSGKRWIDLSMVWVESHGTASIWQFFTYQTAILNSSS